MEPLAYAVQWREPVLSEERRRRDAALTEFVRRLTDRVQPVCIILFGSVARGSDQVASDIDVIVIGGQLPERLFDRLDLLNRLKRGLTASIDAFPYTTEEFEQMLNDLQVTALEAMHDGRPVAGEDYFNQLRAQFDSLVKHGLTRTGQAWQMSTQPQ